MKSTLTFEMPDGSTWGVPVSIIAEDRARHYMGEFGNDLDRSLNEDTIPLFESDTYEIKGWAANNMNWADVKKHAFQIAERKAYTDENFQDAWIKSDKGLI